MGKERKGVFFFSLPLPPPSSRPSTTHLVKISISPQPSSALRFLEEVLGVRLPKICLHCRLISHCNIYQCNFTMDILKSPISQKTHYLSYVSLDISDQYHREKKRLDFKQEASKYSVSTMFRLYSNSFFFFFFFFFFSIFSYILYEHSISTCTYTAKYRIF